jgi:F-type H+-transporting ATPase subunit gamma
MAKTREIKKRIKAVGNIRRITKTMQMIATSKFARAQAASVATRPYTDSIFDLVGTLSAGLGEDAHALLKDGAAGAPSITLIMTSDRGLCGPYNGSILRTSMANFKRDPAARAGEVEMIGRKGLSFMKFAGVKISRHLSQFGDKAKYEDVRAVADEYIARFLKGEISRVMIVSMKYISAGKQVPTVTQLLPFQPPERAKAAQAEAAGREQIYEFSPTAKELLDELLPAAVRSVLFQAMNDAIVSEHVARMVAMKAATDNAGKAGKRLTRVYNRARQAQITTELTEIISGAAALE